MNHNIFLNEKGLIELRIGGEVSITEAVDLGRQGMSLITELEDQNKPVLFLLDSTNSPPEMSEPTIRMSAVIFKAVHFNFAASYGASPQARQRQETILRLAGKTDIFKAFETRTEAETWLLSHIKPETPS